MRQIGLEPGDTLTREWIVLALGPHIAIALIARERDDVDPNRRDEDRRFDFVITHDRAAVTPPPSTCSTASHERTPVTPKLTEPPTSRPATDPTGMPTTLDGLVTAAASELMAATADTSAQISTRVLADLVAHFDVDVSFLRYNDHHIGASTLVAEWPPRHTVPDPDPLAVVYFADADPVFAQCEHAKEPVVIRPRPSTADYQKLLVQAGSGAPPPLPPPPSPSSPANSHWDTGFRQVR